MFTGIIEERGELTAIEELADSIRLTVRGPKVVEDAGHGDSIAVSGVCLTVVAQSGDTFTADVMRQTLVMSTLSDAVVGTGVNLERALQPHTRLGGHIVQGHVDGTGALVSIADGEAWRVLRFSLPADLAPLVADKGSIAVDGVSLTVSGVAPADAAEAWFEVSLIPETLAATTLGARAVGDRVNLETDVLARQVQRLLAFDPAALGAATAASATTTSSTPGSNA